MPFNQHTELGFTVAYIVQLLNGLKFCVIFCPSNTFFIGTCWYIEAFFIDLEKIFQKVDKIVSTKEKDGGKVVNKEILVKSCLIEIVKFHNNILR